ncbi:MAG: tetratricopeptide repeat protein [Fretibacterium sp.]|nr:tetratricopeptide repeat protein [Fretibacterium sp.]
MFAKKSPFWAALALTAVLFAGEALANGNTTADTPEPPPIKKSVRRVKAPRSVRKRAPAKPASKKKVKAVPQPAPVSALDQGVALMKQERYTAARPWLQKAIQQNRRSAAAWYWYGMCHEKTGHFYEAQYFYSKAVECDPTFEPLSRVVAYPNGGDKTPLWDPRRPARVYPVPTDSVMGSSGQGVTIVPPNSPQARPRPSRPALDPELPKVPAYVPPEPGALPQDGDAWHPAVYVPPTMGSVATGRDEGTPVYIPPSLPQGGVPSVTAPVNAGPVYQPPQPPQTAVTRPSPAPQKKAAVTPAVTKTKKKTVKKAPRKAAPKKSAAAKQPAPEPKQPADTQKPMAPSAPKEETLPPAQPRTPPVRSAEYLPPVGQVPQDKVDSVPLPPVGQGEPVKKDAPAQQDASPKEDKGNA